MSFPHLFKPERFLYPIEQIPGSRRERLVVSLFSGAN
jgi:hypothetical protein